MSIALLCDDTNCPVLLHDISTDTLAVSCETDEIIILALLYVPLNCTILCWLDTEPLALIKNAIRRNLVFLYT